MCTCINVHGYVGNLPGLNHLERHSNYSAKELCCSQPKCWHRCPYPYLSALREFAASTSAPSAHPQRLRHSSSVVPSLTPRESPEINPKTI